MSNVSNVSDVCCKSRSGCCICCNDYIRILQAYVSNVSAVSVLSGCCICCTRYTCMLQVYVLNVSAIFKHMLQVFLSGCCKSRSGCCICCNYYTRMLHAHVSSFQVLQTYISNVSSRCCKSKSGCCICCYDYTHMFQAYVLSVSGVNEDTMLL